MNPVIIKKQKIQTNIQLQITKKFSTEQGKIINKRKIQHIYIYTLMDSRFCSLTACLKNAKNTKGQSAICEGLGRNGKIQKNTKNTKCIFFVFYLYFFRIFLYFYKKNTKQIQKKYKNNTNAIAQKYKIQKKIRINNFKNTKYKKNTNPTF